MKFSEWKATTMRKLLELRKKYEELGNAKAVSDLSFLIDKLNYLRSRDLSSFMFYMHIVIRDTKITELYELLPSIDDIKDFFSEEQ